MKYPKAVYFILLLYFFLSCTVADNQNCANNKILLNAASGDVNKIMHCYNSGADILVSDEDGKSVYAIAIKNSHLDLAKRLQEIQVKDWEKAGAPLEPQPLYDAIEYDNVPLVNKFIEADFDISKKHINGVAPVVFAIFNNSNEVLNLLLNHGVDVNYAFDFRPLICIAAMFNQQRTVEILLANGASINDSDGSGVTPLMFAARDGSNNLIRFLLQHGAEKTAVDLENDTALDMAKSAGHDDTVALLSGE